MRIVRLVHLPRQLQSQGAGCLQTVGSDLMLWCKVLSTSFLMAAKLRTFRFIFYFVVGFVVLGTFLKTNLTSYRLTGGKESTESREKVDFTNFRNETGADHLIVPNIVHYIRFNKTEFNFAEYVCILSAFYNQRPETIYFHTNVDQFNGTYWEKIKSVRQLYGIVQIRPIELPYEIFGQKLSEGWRVFHGSDIARVRVMMQYGGIYLDNDVYVVQNLDRYRKYEIVIGWDENQFIGNQVYIGHKDARVLPLILDTYHEYHPELWYYNGGERPTVEVLHKRPELVHRVKLKLGVHMLLPQLFTRYWKEWRDQHTIHLLTGHRSYMDPHYKKFPTFNETMIQTYNYTFGEMARQVLSYVKT